MKQSKFKIWDLIYWKDNKGNCHYGLVTDKSLIHDSWHYDVMGYEFWKWNPESDWMLDTISEIMLKQLRCEYAKSI
jgi:hypothetical protein